MNRRGVLTYVVLLFVFAASFTLASIVPVGEVLKTLSGSVALTSLIGALFKLVTDNAAHERAVLLRRDEQRFNVGVTSHMANTVFDKHVSFCEEYMASVHATVVSLYQHGPSEHALTSAQQLRDIRIRHATWITTGMSQDLEAFETQVRKIGAGGQFVATAAGPAYAEHRQRRIEEIYETFERLLPDIYSKEPGKSDATAQQTMECVRDILDIERLVELRSELIRRAHAGLSNLS